MIFSQQWKLLREDRYNVGWSNSTQPAGRTQQAHSHSAPYWRTQHRHPGGASPLAFTAAKSQRGGHVCTQPWDTRGIACLPNMRGIFWQVFGSACSAHAYSISGFAFDRKQLYMIVGCECVPFRWKIFSVPCKAFVGCQARAQRERVVQVWRFKGLLSMDFLLLYKFCPAVHKTELTYL